MLGRKGVAFDADNEPTIVGTTCCKATGLLSVKSLVRYPVATYLPAGTRIIAGPARSRHRGARSCSAACPACEPRQDGRPPLGGSPDHPWWPLRPVRTLLTHGQTRVAASLDGHSTACATCGTLGLALFECREVFNHLCSNNYGC